MSDIRICFVSSLRLTELQALTGENTTSAGVPRQNYRFSDLEPYFANAPEGLFHVVEVPEGENLLDAAHQNLIPIPTLCGGNLACRCCRVQIASGDTSLAAQGEIEALNQTAANPGDRFSCQVAVRSDLVVVLPPPDEMVG